MMSLIDELCYNVSILKILFDFELEILKVSALRFTWLEK